MAVAILLPFVSYCAAPDGAPPRLVDGTRIERSMPGDAQDRLIVDASRGALVVIVEQIGADLVLRCDNEAHARNSATGRWGPEVVVVEKACDLSVRARSVGMPRIVYRVRAFGFDSAEGRRLPPRIWRLWSQGHYDSGTEDTKGHTAALEKLRQVERAVAARGSSDDRRYLQYGNAHMLRRMGRYAEAIAAYDALTKGLDAKRHSVWFARASNGKGLALRELDRFEDADRAFADAVRYGADRKDAYEWVSARNNRCLILHHYGRLAEARDCYIAVIPLYREAAPNQVAVPMLNLAAAADTLGEPALALKNYRAALELRRAGTDRSSLAIVLLNLANHEAQTGAWPDALKHSLEAQRIFEALGDRPRTTNALRLRGWIYRELGEASRGREYYEAALRVAQESNDRNAIAMAKSGVARSDPDDGAAAAAHREAIAYFVETRQSGFASQEWLMLAERLDAMNAGTARDEALAACEALLQANGNRPYRAHAAMLRGRVALREGRLDEAQARAEAAIALRRQTREPDGLADARLLKARVERRRGRADAAFAEIVRGLDELQRAERLPGSPILAANLYDRRIDLLDEATDMLLGSDAASEADVERAWTLKWKYSRIPEAVSPAPAAADERELVDELRAKVMLLSGSRAPGFVSSSKPYTSEQLAEIATRVDAIESQLDARRAVAAVGVVAPPLGLAAVRAALRPGEAFIAINLGARTSGAWVVTTDAVRWVSLPTRADVIRATRNVVERQGKAEFDVLSRQLSPLAVATASARRLLILPDGPSNLVPFAGLADRDGKYWVERGAIVLLAAPPASTAPLRPSALAPKFPVVVWGGGASGEPALVQSSVRVYRSGADMAELPAVAVEIGLVTRVLGERRVRLGDPRAIAAPETDRWMLHVAGHGLASSEHPYAAALALPSEDGFTFMSAPSLALGARPPSVVFVNVCEGFSGRLFESQPPSSFARRFLEAGANVVVAASWPIEDSRAARFAALLYTELERDPSDVADALARAQRTALRHGGLRELRNWSGYSVIRSDG
ncbi:CHAT domain-containing tetratricopeptide repeat protein [Tahibacter soli]|uniref:CHAT domain-containing tetratricopeptide repeat protein n=1 Tax=Tahibacter soli TaxID=2983605 RepID=A0A9X3YK14_9GAMM|nr:CHAT domain-containing tetratricopeptide repeat protein [Tahibacter soli]MDC8013024.1 CHAT domain-containing tetratricopeptide repeat protein [Tahibacter soli]